MSGLIATSSPVPVRNPLQVSYSVRSLIGNESKEQCIDEWAFEDLIVYFSIPELYLLQCPTYNIDAFQ